MRSLSSGSVRETEDADRPIPLARNGTALRRIQDRGYLIAGVKQDVPGFSYRDPQTGAYGGFEIDLARAVARSIFGDVNKVKFIPANTGERIPLLRSLRRFLVAPLKAYCIASTALASNWWHMGMAGQLPEFLCPKSCVGKQDYVGIDYYWGIPSLRLDRIQRLLDAAMGRFDQAPVYPGVLYDLLRYEASLFPNLPVLIIENGSVDLADNISRSDYIRRHVREVQRAVRDGVRVIGYFCWSITSNREWGLKFGKGSDFGLYHIELDTDINLDRHPTDAAREYQKIIANRGVPASEQ